MFSSLSDLPPGSIVIVPVDNGWLVVHPEDDGIAPSSFVYEDPAYGGPREVPFRSTASLAALIMGEFNEHLQSKHTGGLVVRVAPRGREHEDEDTHEELKDEVSP